MKPEYSHRSKTIRRSPVRDILSYHGRSDMISFAGGLPGLGMLPLVEIEKAAERVFQHYGARALQYGTSEGFQPLRNWIANDLTQKGLKTSSEQVMITSGSQQAMDLVARLFLDAKSKVAIEFPSYNGALQSFGMNEADFLEIPSDEEGPIPDRLEAVLRDNGARLCYMVPTLQNPSGKTVSLRRREELAAILDEAPVWFMEDDPYGDLTFDGNRKPLISGFMKTESIVTGSFSKTVSPSLRVGYLRASSEILSSLLPFKQAMDLHTGLLSQMILYEYLKENSREDHLQKLRNTYREKQRVMLEAISDARLPITIERIPEGGMFLWARLADGIEVDAFAKLALQEGVAIVPGSAFYPDEKGRQHFRLNFTAAEPDEIREGVKRLGRAMKLAQPAGSTR